MIILTLATASNDIDRSRDYTIQHCSLGTPQVQTALDNLYDVLPLAIWDTHYGVTSAPYRAFFKSSYYETIVDRVLSSISIGAPIRPDPLDPGNENLMPSLVCALKPGIMIVHEAGLDVDIYHLCKQNPSWPVMYLGTSNIFICPIFFLVPTLPAAGNCPTVNETTNQFEGDFSAFWQSQVYLLLHEIARFYIDATAEESVDEVMDWNYAISLSPKNATYNALNYVLYVVSIDKECEEFPQTGQAQPSGSRRLGAVPGLVNTSSAEISRIQGLESTQDGKSPYHTDAINVTLTPKNSTFLT